MKKENYLAEGCNKATGTAKIFWVEKKKNVI